MTKIYGGSQYILPIFKINREGGHVPPCLHLPLTVNIFERMKLSLNTVSLRIIRHQTRKIRVKRSSHVATRLSFTHGNMTFGPNSKSTRVGCPLPSAGLQWKHWPVADASSFAVTRFALQACSEPLTSNSAPSRKARMSRSPPPSADPFASVDCGGTQQFEIAATKL